MLENLLETIRSSPAPRVDNLLNVIRHGASLEELRLSVEDGFVTHANSALEDGEPSPRRGSELLSEPRDRSAESSPASSHVGDQNLQAFRDLLEAIAASVDLPGHLSAQLEQLLSQVSREKHLAKPDQTSSHSAVSRHFRGP